MVIEEKELTRFTKCPMMVPLGPTREVSCAYMLTAWALRKAFYGELSKDPSKVAAELREHYIYLYKQNGDTHKDVGRRAITIAHRVFTLFEEYDVIRPVQPYSLKINFYTIQGKYALLRKRRGEKIVHVLVLYNTEPALRKFQAMPPDPISLARYIDAKMTTDYKTVKVLHYPLLTGKSWINSHIDESAASNTLLQILQSMSSKYPVAGPHCKDCETKPCMDIFKDKYKQYE